METEIKLTIDDKGTVSSDWWNHEIGDLICQLCADCGGWRSESKPIDCTAGNKWCG